MKVEIITGNVYLVKYKVTMKTENMQKEASK